MRFSRAFLCALPFAALGLACGKDESASVRVENASALDFQSVEVAYPTGHEEVGPLPSGAVTEYREFERIFSMPYFKARFDGDSGIIQPIDSYGEEKDSGKYTYRLTLNWESQDEYGRLRSELITDE